MRFFIVSFIVILCGFQSKAEAQGHSLYCSQAESTAASQKCLQRHLDTAQNRLNGIYQGLNKVVEGEALTALKELQANWLTYRDAECMWEASLSENPSLKRMNELSCLARITEDRADILSVALNDERNAGDAIETQREYGSFPRWMNVIAKQEPKAYWDYKDRTRFDLDCDGDDEYVMTGVSIKETGNSGLYSALYHVAVAENPPIGTPVATVFDFSIGDVEAESNICTATPILRYIAEDQEAADTEGVSEENHEACTARFTLKSKNCAEQVIYWSGKEYTLEKPEEILQKEENKKTKKK